MENKFRFPELRKVPRGTAFDPEVNEIPREAVQKTKDTNGMALFEEADRQKWFGTLNIPEEKPVAQFKFRYGVCQFIILKRRLGSSCFDLTVPNKNVYFGGKE